ncbi:MAG TPA: DinB family protein [Acidimicrobiales bacterium]
MSVRGSNEWGSEVYGEPCRQCGFSWRGDPAEVRAAVAGLPERLGAALEAATGGERHPTLAWSVTAYVAHVGDNLRIWAEHLAGVARGQPGPVAGYDENALAAARAYGELSLPGVLWSLERSVRDWLDAIDQAPTDLVVDHAERGDLTLDDVVRTTGHDALHHEWDIERSLTAARSARC